MLLPSSFTSLVRFRSLVPALLALTGVLASARAEADEAPVVVVDVKASAADLEPAKLAASIGAELHATAVSPGDARAAGAQGIVTIDLDRGTNELSVTYVARERPLSRRVSLPPDADAARTAAVSLAGNLARNEARDLAAELRRGQAKQPPEQTPKAPTPAKDENESADREERLGGDRLQRALNHYAIADEHSRSVQGWTWTAVGAVAMGADIYVSTRPDGHSVGGLGPAFVGFGIATLLTDGPYEKLVGRTREMSLRATEEEWAHEATSEHRLRLWTGVAGLVLTGAALTVGTVIAVDKDWSMSDRARQDWAVTLLAEGVVIGSLSGYVLGTEGPLEQGLHAYENTVGRTIRPSEGATLHFNVAPTTGGAFAGVGGTF